MKSTRAFVARFFSTRSQTLFLLVDVALFNLGVVAAYYVRHLGPPDPQTFSSYRDMTTFVVGMPMIVFYFSGLYRVRWSYVRAEEFLQVFRAALISTIMLLFISYAFRSDLVAGPPEQRKIGIPTGVIIISYLTVSGLMVGRRLVARTVRRRFFTEERPVRLLLVGYTAFDAEVIERLRSNENPSYHLVGFLGEESPSLEERGLEWVGGLKDVDDVLALQDIDEVLIDASDLLHKDVVRVVQACDGSHVRYRVIPTFLDMMATNATVELVNYLPMVRFGRPDITGWSALFKRIFDLAVAATMLMLFSPFLLIACIWIVVDSKGGPFFSQERVGRYGRRFRIHKFRTMRVGAEREGALTTDDDPRITRAGRALRRWSIDELPQLLNVLKGEMSLVGPRAVVPCVVESFDEFEKMTLNVPPGITGLAQVSGRDALSFRDKSLLNIYYVRNYSILMDMKILIKTVAVVLSGEGTGGTRVD